MFRNRREAGLKLAGLLAHCRDQHPLVLALPRGGVPVAFEIAEALQAELDVLIVRKIGAPHQPELGLGALVDGNPPQVVWNEDLLRRIRPSQDYLDAEQARQRSEIARRRHFYRGDRPPPVIAGRSVIVVDDGIATGGTARAALKGLRQMRPARVTLAVGVAPPDVADALQSECDEVAAAYAPEPFFAVGMFYEDFEQTSDAEVVDLLGKAGRSHRA